MKEVNDLLKRLGELEDAPLIWINKKVYDMAQEIKRLKEEYMILQNASDEVEEELQQRIDKALSYLRDIGNWLRDDSSYRAKLIDILQGSDKE